MTCRRAGPATQKSLEAARHLCQEARAVLTSLRGGPPGVARGDLAGDLMDLRGLVKLHLESEESTVAFVERSIAEEERPVTPTTRQVNNESGEPQEDGNAIPVDKPPESPMPTSKICNFSGGPPPLWSPTSNRSLVSPQDVGIFARPFLAVVMDPRAAGPHTLVALRALFRLLERGSLATPSSTKHSFHVSLEPLMKGVLACRFEQTDAGADEAVEMAIADLLALLVSIDQSAFLPATLMEAFNTVFVTRNTFVHSPALCYHFEDVLATMILSTFSNVKNDETACLILEFLVNQMLHTPLGGGGDTLDDAAREAQAAHDATRVLCLRLTRCCLRTGYGPSTDLLKESSQEERPAPTHPWEDRSLLSIIQDDLCLSLLMTGQAIWAHHDDTSNISPGIISLEVLSEICATLSTLWNTVSLRRHLIAQFEQIFTGFYQRALVLLRKRANPTDSVSFNANLVFDSEVEIILESLVDLLGLHEPGHGHASGDAGALEALFATYDCDMTRSDVASELVVELCRCCGGVINDEGDVMLGVFPKPKPYDEGNTDLPLASNNASSGASSEEVQIEYWRQVPAHLKELCAEALVGCMKCLFENQDGVKSAVMLDDIAKEGKSSGDEECSVRSLHSRKRLMRKAARLFNEKSKKGIECLVSSGLVSDPITPMDVALFLRNGLVVGLDKAAVGIYLGELGKAAEAGKSPPIWERDWFHKEVLIAYCSLFRFEGQPLLDGLRMFLAAFRLPGEAQQIDRIIQAFADSCGRKCDESARLKLFSDTPERASDPAFLLSFSIIMLTTDLHNKNIREDRKMSLEAFIRNNTNYGQDITEPGKELPRDFLTSIYESIKEEAIRTEADGAEGAITVERWKDVLRGSSDESAPPEAVLTTYDDAIVKELVIENLWMPIVSVIGSFWGVVGIDEDSLEATASSKAGEGNPNAMLGVQGARLGMDMAIDLLLGVLNMGRLDIFREIFSCVCFYTGLLGEYNLDAVDRTWSFVNSVEAQSAVIAVMKIAKAAGDKIGVEGWKQVWALLFELRDLKLLCGGKYGILKESDPDFLREDARRDWTMYMAKGGFSGSSDKADKSKRVSSVLGVMGRALFGGEVSYDQDGSYGTNTDNVVRTIHGKEELLLWDELAPSDDESEDDGADNESVEFDSPSHLGSAGARFESQLIHEDLVIQEQTSGSVPVTGLERMEDTRPYQISPRARVRKRLFRASDFSELVSESRFMDLGGVQDMIRALSDILQKQKTTVTTGDSTSTVAEYDRLADTAEAALEESRRNDDELVISPASEAFAEVLICEIALKNRDRLGILWKEVLKGHYHRRLGKGNPITAPGAIGTSDVTNKQTLTSPGIEKCVTGLLRISSCAVMRENVGSEVLTTLHLVCPSEDDAGPVVGAELGRHIGEGLWRICRNIDGLCQLSTDGWDGLLGLAEWCATIGGQVDLDQDGIPTGLASDDPALLAYRSLHLMLHAPELKDSIPLSATRSIRAVIIAGERARFPKLSIAGLDLLLVLHSYFGDRTPAADEIWVECWIPVLDAIAEAGKLSMFTVSTDRVDSIHEYS